MASTEFGIETPLGPMRAQIADGRLVALAFGASAPSVSDETADRALCRRLQRQMDEWWAGRRADFDVPLAHRGTPFQRAVWAAARAVPRGRVTSYGELAARIGRPTSARAVGHALGRNPWLLVVPCHRVVATDGGLTGYAGGIDRKRALLSAESR